MMMDTVSASEILEESSTTQCRNQKKECQSINIGHENLKSEKNVAELCLKHISVYSIAQLCMKFAGDSEYAVSAEAV
jgi:hypothetical protein